MKELKKVFNFIKEKFQNPRTRAAVILGIYLVFFVILTIALRTADTKETNNNTPNNYYVVNNDYNYTYNVEINKNNNTNKYLITGINNNGNVNEIGQLYNNETKTYENILEYDDVNPKFTDLSNIISYVNNLKEEFTTNYKDGTVQKNYLVEVNKIDNNLDSDEKIEINVYEKDNFIPKIIIDGTNLDSKNNTGITYSKYILEYEKINNEQTNLE